MQQQTPHAKTDTKTFAYLCTDLRQFNNEIRASKETIKD